MNNAPLLPGINFAGSDLVGLHAKSPAVCRQRCTERPQCFAFTFIRKVTRHRACWLKGRNYARRKEASAGTVSGAVRGEASTAVAPRTWWEEGEPSQPIRFRNSTGTLLVCLIGSLRGGSSAWNSLIEHVLQPLAADLAILGEQTDRSQALLFARAAHIWPAPEPDDWGALVDNLTAATLRTPFPWRRYARSSSHTGLWGGVKLGRRRLQGSGAIMFALRMLLLRRLQEGNLMHRYDQIMVTRS